MGWLQNYRERKQARHAAYLEKRRIAGYDYAAGCLLRGASPIDMQYRYDTSVVFNENDGCRAFDRGMEEATDRIVALKIVEDDRVDFFLG